MFFPGLIRAGFMYLLLSTVSIHAESLTRDSALQIALKNNPDIVAAQASWQAEKARTLQTWALPSPELELEYEGMPSAFDFGQYEQRTVGFSQQMAFPVTWWQQHQAARHQMQAVHLSVYEKTRLDVSRDVYLAYDRVLADEHTLHLTERHVQLAEDFLERAKVRFEAGDTPQLDVLRAEVDFARLQNKLTVVQNAVSISRSKVNVLLGWSPNAQLILADSLAFVPVSFDRDRLSDQAVLHRHDFLATAQTLQSAKAMQKVSKLSIIPDVTFQIARQTAASPAGFLKSWRTGFVFELPLWAMFDQRGKISEATFQYKQAMARQEKVRLRVLQEVDAAYNVFQSVAQRMILMQERIRPTAEKAYTMAKRSYDEGKASYLDFLDAQRDMVEIDIEYVETLLAYRSAHVQLLYAIGKEPNELALENGQQQLR